MHTGLRSFQPLVPPGELRGSVARSAADLPLTSLWEWRRLISELYAEVRALEPSAAWSRWCCVRDQLFRDHPQSPIPQEERSTFPGVDYFPYDPSSRFTVALDQLDSSDMLTMAVGRDGEVNLRPFARTRGLHPRTGAELTLYWISGYGGGVFLPFGDGTNGSESFAGGRYLLDTIKGADLGWTEDRKAILDFNFAYNPSCSYSDRWVCPLAPVQKSLLSQSERVSGVGAEYAHEAALARALTQIKCSGLALWMELTIRWTFCRPPADAGTFCLGRCTQGLV